MKSAFELLAAGGALEAVAKERERQDAKWGEQNHDAGTWALIIIEELGEWAKAELHKRFGGPEAENARVEMVHTMAVWLAVIECMDRTSKKARGKLCAARLGTEQSPHVCKLPAGHSGDHCCVSCNLLWKMTANSIKRPT